MVFAPFRLVLLLLVALVAGVPLAAASELPERLSQSDPRSTLGYLESYLEDWKDDERLQRSQLSRACRRIGPNARSATLKDAVPALGLVHELPVALENRRLLDPRGLDLELRRILQAFGAGSFNERESLRFSELFARRAHDRLQLFDRVIESQWLLVRVADRQYRDRIAALLEEGGTRVGLTRGNASLCAAITLRIERDRVLSIAAQEISTVVQRLLVESGGI